MFDSSRELLALVVILGHNGWKIHRGPEGEVFADSGNWHTRAEVSQRKAGKLLIQVYAETGDPEAADPDDSLLLTISRYGADAVRTWKACIVAIPTVLASCPVPVLLPDPIADTSVPF